MQRARRRRERPENSCGAAQETDKLINVWAIAETAKGRRGGRAAALRGGIFRSRGSGGVC